MGNIVSVFVFGLSLGFILFLLAAGLTLTMGLMRIINLAHGALYMVGGYVALYVASHAHNWWLGVLLGALCAGAIGLLLETVFLRRLYGKPTSQVLLTIGFIYIITGSIRNIWGGTPSGQLLPSWFDGSLHAAGVIIPEIKLFIIGFGLVMAVLLWLLQEKTRIGAVVRAGMDNREIAGALGINLKRVFTGIFLLGAFIAGMCGLIGATATGINLKVAWDVLLLSMIVVVVGGTGSIQGALVGGIVLGLLNSFGSAYFSDYAGFVSYVALILVLLIKPSGLLGRAMTGGAEATMYLETPKGRRRRSLAQVVAQSKGPLGPIIEHQIDRGTRRWAAVVKAPLIWANGVLTETLLWLGRETALFARRLGRAVAPPFRWAAGAIAPPFRWMGATTVPIRESYSRAASRRAKWVVGLHKGAPYAVILLVLALVPTAIGEYQQGILTKVLIFALLAISLDLTMGYAGLVSFGHAAFLGVAGYTLLAFIVKLGITSFWISAPIALAVTAVTALIIGYISLRVSGIYYLLVTMGLGQVLFVVATNWTRVTNGIDGLTWTERPNLGFAIQWNNLRYYYMVLVILIVCFVILRFIVSSSFGRTLVGVRLNEQRMRSLGFNTWRQKYVGVVVGGIFAGVAGILFAYEGGSMTPSTLMLDMSSLPMLMVIMGGRGTLWGPCLGAAVVVLVKEYAIVHWSTYWDIILGVTFVISVMFLPNGFARYLSKAWDRWGFLRRQPEGGRKQLSKGARP